MRDEAFTRHFEYSNRPFFFFREKQTEGQRNWISTEKNTTEKKNPENWTFLKLDTMSFHTKNTKILLMGLL